MFNLETQDELVCVAKGNGKFFAKLGAMVADQGRLSYTKRLLGSNDGSLLGQIGNHLARRVTGENMKMVEISGDGLVYLANQEMHVFRIDLEPNGPWQRVCMESENILAFTDGCHLGIELFGGGMLQRDLFKSVLSYERPGAHAVLLSQGNPLVLEAPCRVDPDALIAWTGRNPEIRMNVDVFKTLIGQANGESYLLEFIEPGQIVIVQPSERKSQVGLAIDGNGNQNSYNNYSRSDSRNDMQQMANTAQQVLSTLTGSSSSINNRVRGRR